MTEPRLPPHPPDTSAGGLPALFSLSGQVAVVTGGSRGLGLQMARALGQAGATVLLVARKAAELDEAATALAAEGLRVATCAADLSDLERLPALVAGWLATHGRLDVLVNNAGMAWAAPATDITPAQWHKVMALNLDGLFFLSREVARQAFIPQGWGKVVHIASVGGLQGNSPDMHTVAYNASKGAVVNLTRALASEWGPHGLHVNAICPGFFPTQLSQGFLRHVEAGVLAKTPLRRMGGEEDLMGTVLYLASRASHHVTGQCIVVDGGASTTLFGDLLPTAEAPPPA
ncbi:glucose 1-dehydrogenase [Ideonella livida]|uniref:Glucose 1-dehydrogenase n=1 Tax=Ideonella livida TaxID=2707176 RepID=A0A7C9TPC3_9BURK|nr:glucose 1-dehydrogenase [Ideonella livida]NDY93666.1 glucose 1-dehydrogenase [Ideonella livida]